MELENGRGAGSAPPELRNPSRLGADLYLREVDLVERIDRERALDVLVLERAVRVPVDRDDWHLAVRPEHDLLALAVVVEPPLLVEVGGLHLVHEPVVLLVAEGAVVVPRLARPLIEEVDRVGVVADPAEPVDVD